MAQDLLSSGLKANREHGERSEKRDEERAYVNGGVHDLDQLLGLLLHEAKDQQRIAAQIDHAQHHQKRMPVESLIMVGPSEASVVVQRPDEHQSDQQGADRL